VYAGRAKESAVVAYQTGAVMQVRTAKPSHWRHGGGWIRISYSFRLSRAVDCDNAMKALNDAVALAIGVDDKFFLPCVTWKTIDKHERSPGVDLTRGARYARERPTAGPGNARPARLP